MMAGVNHDCEAVQVRLDQALELLREVRPYLRAYCRDTGGIHLHGSENSSTIVAARVGDYLRQVGGA